MCKVFSNFFLASSSSFYNERRSFVLENAKAVGHKLSPRQDGTPRRSQQRSFGPTLHWLNFPFSLPGFKLWQLV
jgi:hypothetical protein